MEIKLAPEKEALLKELATRKGSDAPALAAQVLGLYLEHEARFIDAAMRGVASLERGEYVEHEEVRARLDRFFQS